MKTPLVFILTLFVVVTTEYNPYRFSPKQEQFSRDFAEGQLDASKQSPAQNDGDIISQKRIANFEELINYIVQTEGRERDSIKLDPERYSYLQQANLHGITYLSDSLKVNGFLLTPKESGKFPAIIYNRGGSLGWGSLTHYVASIGLGDLARLSASGYVVVASQYRGNGGSEGKEEYMGADINDVTNLIPLLSHIPHADTSRIGMFGWSRGGATTFAAMRKTNRLKAIAVGGPGTNLVAVAQDRPELKEWWSEFIPGFKEDWEAALKQRSPYFWVDELPKDVPMLIMHGTADIAARARETLKFAVELDKHQLPYKLIMYEGDNHALRLHRDEMFSELITWFNRFVRDGEEKPKAELAK